MAKKFAAIARKKSKQFPLLVEIYKYMAVGIGAVLVAVGLELFLVPNGFLDGGVVGIAIILSNFVGLPLGVFIALLNIPFVVLAWVKLGRRSALKTVVGIVVLSVATVVLHHREPWTEEYVLALGYGGLLLGVGAGLALRAGGALDGLDALASVVSNNSSFTVDQIILYINIVIFSSAAFVLTPESAMGSALLFYVVVAPLIHKIVEGDSSLRLVEILTEKPTIMIEKLHEVSPRRIYTTKTKALLASGQVGELFVVRLLVSVIEEAAITEAAMAADKDAVIIYKEVNQVRGGVYEK